MSSGAVITDNNFQVIGTAMGKSSTVKVLGIGGLKKNALVFDAKKDLLQNYPLKEGQALTNVIVDFKREYLIIMNRTTAYLYADIVDFNHTDKKKENNYFVKEYHGFNVGDSVFVSMLSRYEKMLILDLDFSYVLVKGSDNREKHIEYSKLFKREGQIEIKSIMYSVGQAGQVTNTSTVTGEEITRQLKVIGVNDRHVLFVDDNGEYHEL